MNMPRSSPGQSRFGTCSSRMGRVFTCKVAPQIGCKEPEHVFRDGSPQPDAELQFWRSRAAFSAWQSLRGEREGERERERGEREKEKGGVKRRANTPNTRDPATLGEQPELDPHAAADGGGEACGMPGVGQASH